MARSTLKRCCTSLTTRAMQIKATRYHLTADRMATIKVTESSQCWQRHGHPGTLVCTVAGGSAKWRGCREEQRNSPGSSNSTSAHIRRRTESRASGRCPCTCACHVIIHNSYAWDKPGRPADERIRKTRCVQTKECHPASNRKETWHVPRHRWTRGHGAE